MRNAISPRLAISTFSNTYLPALRPSPPACGGRGRGPVAQRVLAPRGIPHLTPPLSTPKGGEGNFHLPADRLQHTPNVLHYISVPEPDHPIAMAGNVEASILIFFGTKCVLSAVNLDDQLRGWTGKVDNVFADWMLTTKSSREPKLAQLAPQPPLCLCHVPPQPPRE